MSDYRPTHADGTFDERYSVREEGNGDPYAPWVARFCDDEYLGRAATMPEAWIIAKTHARGGKVLAGYVSAKGGKWHQATVQTPTFMHNETTVCGRTFRPVNVTWDGDPPPCQPHHMCRQCREKVSE